MQKQEKERKEVMRTRIDNALAEAPTVNRVRAKELIDSNRDLIDSERSYWIARATLEYEHVVGILMHMRFGKVSPPTTINTGPNVAIIEEKLGDITRELKGLRRDVKQGPRSIRQRLIDLLK